MGGRTANRASFSADLLRLEMVWHVRRGIECSEARTDKSGSSLFFVATFTEWYVDMPWVMHTLTD
jgi:hypothetical protein